MSLIEDLTWSVHSFEFILIQPCCNIIRLNLTRLALLILGNATTLLDSEHFVVGSGWIQNSGFRGTFWPAVWQARLFLCKDWGGIVQWRKGSLMRKDFVRKCLVFASSMWRPVSTLFAGTWLCRDVQWMPNWTFYSSERRAFSNPIMVSVHPVISVQSEHSELLFRCNFLPIVQKGEVQLLGREWFQENEGKCSRHVSSSWSRCRCRQLIFLSSWRFGCKSTLCAAKWVTIIDPLKVSGHLTT